MKLWLLTRKDRVGFDEYYGFVIAADSETSARDVASVHHGDEPKDSWKLSARSDCVDIGESDVFMVAQVVLGSFKAG